MDNKIKTNLIRDTLNILDIKAGNRMKFYETLRRNLKTAEQRRKISPDSRFFYWRQAQFDRDRFEEKNQGGFLKISCNEKYEKFREFALKSWEEMTGTNSIL